MEPSEKQLDMYTIKSGKLKIFIFQKKHKNIQKLFLIFIIKIPKYFKKISIL